MKRTVKDILFLALVTGACLLGLLLIKQLVINNAIEAFMPRDSATVEVNDENELIFGSQEYIMVSVEQRYGSVLSAENMETIRRFTEEIEAIPHVDEVYSLSNMDYIKNSAEGMEVVDLYPADLDEAEALTETKRRIADWKDVYVGNFISSDEGLSVIMVEIEVTDDDRWHKPVYEALKEVAAGYERDDLRIRYAGIPVILDELTQGIMRDLTLLIPLAALVILTVLYFTFLRVEGMVLPMVSLLVSLILTMAVMSLLRLPFTVATMLVPILLLVVGSAYGIHFLAHFYETASGRKGFLKASQLEELIREVRREIAPSIGLAALTTVVGFLALMTSPVVPFRTFALLSALGVALSLVSALYFIPLLLRLRYRGGCDAEHFQPRSIGSKEGAEKSPFFLMLQRWAEEKKGLVILTMLLAISATVLLAPRIETGSNFLGFFPEKSNVVQATNLIGDRLSGTGQITIQFEAPSRGDILDPAFLSEMERFESYMTGALPNVSRVNSIVPQVKRMNKIMNFDSVPYPAADAGSEDTDFFADLESGDGEEDFFDLSAEEPEDDFFNFDDVEDYGMDSESADVTDWSATAAAEAVEEPVFEALSYNRLAEDLRNALLNGGTDTDVEEILRLVLASDNFEGAAFEEIPLDPAKYGLETRGELKDLISQYLILYSGSLDTLINDGLEPDMMLASVIIKDESNKAVTPVLKEIEQYWDQNIPEGWRFRIAGNNTIINELDNLLIHSQILSVLGALLFVFLLLVLLYRSPMAGLIGLIPVLAGLTGLFLTMHIGGFKLDLVTSMLAALSVGVGVDYSIHLLTAYRREIGKGNTAPLSAVYRTTGKAILFNALSVASGFLTLVLSSFIPVRQLGLIFAVSMFFAALASLLVMPVVLELFQPGFLHKPVSLKKISFSKKSA